MKRENNVPPITIHDLVWATRQRDLRQILETLLARLVEVTGAQGGGLLFVSAQEPIVLRQGDLSPKAMAALNGWDHALLNRMKQGPVHVEIASQVEFDNGSTLIKLPINSPDAVIGHIGLLYPSGSRPKLSALENVRGLIQATGSFVALLDELTTLRKRLDRLSLLYEVGQALASTLDLSALLYETIQLATDVINAEGGSLMLLDEQTNELVFQIAYGSQGEELSQFRMPATEGIAGWVCQHGEPVIANDPQSDPRFSNRVDRQIGFHTRSILCVPLQIKGHTIGVLEVVNKRSPAGFDEEDKELLLTLASQAAIALENARLYKNLREERDRILHVQEEVRREIARNLHDGTVQLLASIAMNIGHVRRLLKHAPDQVEAELDNIEELVQHAIRETRNLLFELRPLVLETRGLGAALEAHISRLDQNVGPPIHLSLPAELPSLPPQVARTLFAIIQEAINNARKHAQDATGIWVTLTSTETHLEVEVRDDGRGFDLQKVEAQYEELGSLGLVNMRERAALIDAQLTIESKPNVGTRVFIRVPLQTAAPTIHT